MKQKTLLWRRLPLLVALLGWTFLASANDVIEVDGLRYRLPSSGDQVTLVGGTLRTGHLTVPSNIQYRNRTFSVTEIGSKAFQNCDFDKVTISGMVKKIGESAFEQAGIRELIVEDGVQEIGMKTFMGCKMQTVALPNSVTRILYNAFKGCTHLKTVLLGSGLRVMVGKAFDGCDSIDVVQCTGPVPERSYLGDDNYFSNMTYQFAKLKVPIKYILQYSTAEFSWPNFEQIEPINSVEAEWSPFDKLAMEYCHKYKEKRKKGNIWIRSNTYDPHPDGATLFNVQETTNKKGKVRSNYTIASKEEWNGFRIPTEYIIAGQDNTIMLHGTMTFRGMKTPVDFYSVPQKFSIPRPAVFQCVTEDGGSLTIEMKNVAEEGRGITSLFSIQPVGPQLSLTYTAPDGSTQKYVLRVIELPKL